MTTPAFSSAESHLLQAERVLVVRLSAMGDIIHGMPAIAALRQSRPNLQVGWLIEERWSELLCSGAAERSGLPSARKPLVDRVHVANFSAWRRALLSSQSWSEIRACVREVRAMKYDVVLDLQGAIRSALTARLSGAKVRVGSAQPREGPARMLYTRAVRPQGVHVVEQALSLASAVAAEQLSYVDPPFPTDAVNESWVDALQCRLGSKPLAIINPGAGWGAKCWPPESFGAVARALADRGMTVLINHGPGEEALGQSVRSASGNTAVLLNCRVGELIAVMRRARLFVGGDTGPMHLAAAFRVPVVALFGPTRPERNGPFATRCIVLRNPESVPNTTHTDRPDEGLHAIEPGAVMDAAERLLGDESG